VIEQDSRKAFACNGQQIYPYVIIAGLTISPSLVHMDLDLRQTVDGLVTIRRGSVKHADQVLYPPLYEFAPFAFFSICDGILATDYATLIDVRCVIFNV